MFTSGFVFKFFWILAFIISGFVIRNVFQTCTKLWDMTLKDAFFWFLRRCLILGPCVIMIMSPVFYRPIFRKTALVKDGKVVKVYRPTMFIPRTTWDLETEGGKVMVLDELTTIKSEQYSLCVVPLQASTTTNNIELVIRFDGVDSETNLLNRLQFVSGPNLNREDESLPSRLFGYYCGKIVVSVFTNSPNFNSISGLVLGHESEVTNGSSALQFRQELLKLSEETSDHLWIRFGLRITDVTVWSRVK